VYHKEITMKDYSKIIDLEKFAIPAHTKKNEATETDIPEWATPIIDSVTKAETLVREILTEHNKKSVAPDPLFGKLESEGSVSPAVTEYLKTKK